MPRIRSVHPGLFTDEAFMSASIYARVLMIGLWTEAMDDGVFEWKPIVLKARLFPADACDVEQLLGELVKLNVLKRIEHKGKAYGVLRNFRRYQRPKKPNDSGILSEPDRAYVGLVPNQCGTSTEIPPQMEDEGEGCRGEGNANSPDPTNTPELSERRSDIAREAIFVDFWDAFPRDGTESRSRAEKEFRKLTPSDRRLAIAAIPAFKAAQAAALAKHPDRSGLHPWKYLAERRWEGHRQSRLSVAKFFAPEGSRQMAEWNRVQGRPYPTNATGPDGHTKGWYFDFEWPPSFDPGHVVTPLRKETA